MYTWVPCEGKIKKKKFFGQSFTYHVLCRVVRFNFENPLSESSPMSYMCQQQIRYELLMGMNDKYYFHFMESEGSKEERKMPSKLSA